MTDEESIGDWVEDQTEDVGSIDYTPGAGPYSGAEERDGGDLHPLEPESPDIDLDEALEILNRKVEENNRELEESLENIYGDLEDHDEQIIELAHFTRHNRDRIQENFENVDDLWHEIDNIYNEIDNVDGGTTNYNIDFTGIENSLRYIGGGIKNFFSWGSEKTEDFDPDRRKVLAGIVGGAAIIDYSNILPGDKNAGDGYLRIGECGGELDAGGLLGEQERCTPQDTGNGEGTPSGDDGSGDPVDNVQTPYERDVELSDEDLQYAIENTEGTDQELSNIKNIDGNLNDFGYNSGSDEFYVEVEDGNEETQVEISEEAYWNAVDN